MPSSRAARAHGLIAEPSAAGAGAVSARNRSTAATIAAASDSAGPVAIISIRGRGGLRWPLPLMARDLMPYEWRVPRVPVFDADAVFATVSPSEAVERTRTAFLRHHAGDWVMPAKVYV